MMVIVILLFGLIIGSFLNVCIYRLPQSLPITAPPSRCIRCRQKIKSCHLIPVISWLMLRGRCRYCKTAISIRYPAVELLTGLLFAFCFVKLGLSPNLFAALILTSFFIVIALIDFDHQLILDSVLIWLAGAGIVVHLLMNQLSFSLNYTENTGNFTTGAAGGIDMLLGILAGAGLLLAIAAASRGGVGCGDIKFAAALGVWLGWQYNLLTLFIAFLLGGLTGGLLLALNRKKRKDYIPFGPFIAIGAWISFLYGPALIECYVRW